MSASTAAEARLLAGRAHAVQLPLAPVTARPQARRAPPYRSASGSRDATMTVRYIHPVATPDGTIFVTGLQSKSGSTGSSGPIYSLPGG